MANAKYPFRKSFVARARSYRWNLKGWIIRRWLDAYDAWEPEEDSLQYIYRTKSEALAALAGKG